MLVPLSKSVGDPVKSKSKSKSQKQSVTSSKISSKVYKSSSIPSSLSVSMSSKCKHCKQSLKKNKDSIGYEACPCQMKEVEKEKIMCFFCDTKIKKKS